ncbi:MAG: hypothetical protein IJ025_04695 [Clostridia bacterium]|nr:hypothetical protein [Clostridia bacterium]
MTTLPKLEETNVNYVFEIAENILQNSTDLRAGSESEENSRHILLYELMKYCDETNEQSFFAYPGAGSLIHKILCIGLIICVILFSISVDNGYVLPVAVSLFLNIILFCVFAYKFIFDGNLLDRIRPKKLSGNILGKRYAAGNTETRVVLTAHLDSPKSIRNLLFGNRWPLILSICSVIGNTILFCSQLAFLYTGAPANADIFEALRGIALMFMPFYILSFFLISYKKNASGVSSSIIPSATLVSIMKQFSEDSFRFRKTEVCCLLTGAEYSSRAGSYAFAKKYRRLFSDVRTVFIPLEEITTSEKLAVFFKDGSGAKGSAEVASVIAQAAENLELNLSKESSLLGTASFTPFSNQHFRACSLGTSKKHISKSVSPNTDRITSVRRKTVSDVGALIIETLNYFDS